MMRSPPGSRSRRISSSGESSRSILEMRHWLGRTALPRHVRSVSRKRTYRASRPFLRMRSMNILMVPSGTLSTFGLSSNSSVSTSLLPMPQGSSRSSGETRCKLLFLLSSWSLSMWYIRRIASTQNRRSSSTSGGVTIFFSLSRLGSTSLSLKAPFSSPSPKGASTQRIARSSTPSSASIFCRWPIGMPSRVNGSGLSLSVTKRMRSITRAVTLLKSSARRSGETCSSSLLKSGSALSTYSTSFVTCDSTARMPKMSVSKPAVEAVSSM
mmetsp:Transcript_25161/g.74734  ORF Transcript_25161/g.74734 Transcript_25161/m.74734 type:complete len:269 (+) Transcript_25161:6054-6860(+)